MHEPVGVVSWIAIGGRIKFVLDRIEALTVCIGDVCCSEIAAGSDVDDRVAVHGRFEGLDGDWLRIAAAVLQIDEQLGIVTGRANISVDVEAPEIAEGIAAVRRD